MPRIYLTNDSYPELRDLPRWTRTMTWWRAIRHALGHGDFWRFAAAQFLVALAFLVAVRIVLVPGLPGVAGWAFAAAWFAVFAYLQVSWGGDMMRSHLRAVSETARCACPGCGHSLVGHLLRDQAATSPIRCPECAASVPRDLFGPPYRVPPRFRAFPPWRSDTA